MLDHALTAVQIIGAFAGLVVVCLAAYIAIAFALWIRGGTH